MIRLIIGALTLYVVNFHCCTAFVPNNIKCFKANKLCMQSDDESENRGKILVSGFLTSKVRTDQFVFDVLHAQSKWNSIVAFSPSTSFAKKRLISRTARYSGLSDVLEFKEGDAFDSLTMAENLSDCTSWLCFDCPLDKLRVAVDIAKSSAVSSLVLCATISSEEAKSSGVYESLKESGLSYTFIRMGKLLDGKESGSICVRESEEDLPTESIVREDACRVAAESFRIDGAKDRAIAIGKGDEDSIEFLKSLRQKGADRLTEIENLLGSGIIDFKEAKRKAAGIETEEEKAERLKKQEEANRVANEESRKRDLEMRERTYQRRVNTEIDNILRHDFTTLSWIGKRGIEEEDYMSNEENREKVKPRAVKRVEAYQRGDYDYDSDVERREKQFPEPDEESDDKDDETKELGKVDSEGRPIEEK
eukprot:CAMPEP_0171455944 /NCGR_PEP_ID=MMETSP0945-20130129/2634_1 /TAXON_ID=109269 /ORGANISM="Vaucheria litorea, Strain CCMP2940" /LENGTH=420 /DNA_ID=CAMNT_0011981281 /DNA_START=43 /DNA_END=1305 /DNA_ORIENTATION=+